MDPILVEEDTYLVKLKKNLKDLYDLTLEELNRNYEYVGGLWPSRDPFKKPDKHSKIFYEKFGNKSSLEVLRNSNSPDFVKKGFLSKCCCNHPIKQNCYLYNEEENKFVILGNCCIKKYVGGLNCYCINCKEIVNINNKKNFNYCNECYKIKNIKYLKETEKIKKLDEIRKKKLGKDYIIKHCLDCKERLKHNEKFKGKFSLCYLCNYKMKIKEGWRCCTYKDCKKLISPKYSRCYIHKKYFDDDSSDFDI